MTFLLIAALVLLVPPLLLPWLAEESILVTRVQEGTVKAIMRGDSFERFVMSFAGHHLNQPGKAWYNKKIADWTVLAHGKADDALYDDRNWLLKLLGLYWVGWPWASKVYVYEFEWNETQTVQEGERLGKEEVRARKEHSDFAYVADFVYAIVTDGAETSDNLATDELTLITVAMVNPYRALFSGEDWMRRTTAAINGKAREFVGSHKFTQLIKNKKEWTDFQKEVVGLSSALSDEDLATATAKQKRGFGLSGRYGIQIRAADLQSIALSGDAAKRNVEATTRQYLAEQEAKATIVAAGAKAKEITLVADAEAGGLDARLAVINKHGPAGVALAGYDAVRDAAKEGNTVIWGNNPLGAIEGMLRHNQNRRPQPNKGRKTP